MDLLAHEIELLLGLGEGGLGARQQLGRRHLGLQRQRELLAVELGAEAPVAVGLGGQLGLEELLVAIERRQRRRQGRVVADEGFDLGLDEVDRSLVGLDALLEVDGGRLALAGVLAGAGRRAQRAYS